MNTKTLLASTLVLALAACASTPKKQEIVQQQPPAPQQTQPRVFTDPAPTGPVEQAPVQQVPQIAQQGPVPGTVEDFKYQSGEDRVYFGYDRYDLTPQARDVLRRQAEWLKQYSTATVVVEGNADERGTREYNLALGARRANTVKAFLISQGVSPSRITTVSYGKERPIDPRSNEEAWSLNRNAHTRVIISGGLS